MSPKKTKATLSLTGFEDIFNISADTQDGERIVQISLTELFPPEFHPFSVVQDEAMTRLVESVKKYGVREPGIARPRADGGYELLSGNRRKMACELAGNASMPVIIRELDDDIAALLMVDSNLDRREEILTSELAWAYKVMMEALNHSGVKNEQHSFEIMANRIGKSRNQLYRYIRLTELVIALADKVDSKQLAFNPAVELSYLTQKEQTAVANAMAAQQIKPSLSQAVRLKKLSQSKELTAEMIDAILSEEKKPPIGGMSGFMRFRKYFPPDYSPKQIEAVIIRLLKDWKAKEAV